jgi:hypothetical protein
MAPPAMRVPQLMKELFEWVSTTDIHPLISSSVFHYEFEFIHPFADGNGRMGRLWQTLILSKWQPFFAWLPVESMIHDDQQGYYNALGSSDNMGDAFLRAGDVNEAVVGAGIQLSNRWALRWNAIYNMDIGSFQSHTGGVFYNHPCYYMSLQYRRDNAIKQDYVGTTTFQFKIGMAIDGVQY